MRAEHFEFDSTNMRMASPQPLRRYATRFRLDLHATTAARVGVVPGGSILTGLRARCAEKFGREDGERGGTRAMARSDGVLREITRSS